MEDLLAENFPGLFTIATNVNYMLAETGESTKHGPLVHGPPPWTGSMDRVHQNMDLVHGPPNHGPGPWTPYFYKLRLHHKLRFDDLW